LGNPEQLQVKKNIIILKFDDIGILLKNNHQTWKVSHKLPKLTQW